MPEEPTPRALLRHLYGGGTAIAFLKEHDEKYGLIARWKKEDREFAEQYEEAISATRTSNHDQTVEAREPEWQDAFLSAYAELASEASIAAAHRLLKDRGFSIALGTIYARLSESHTAYNEQFTTRFLSAEAARLAPIEEKLHEQMAAGEVPAIAFKHLQTHKLTRDRYKPPVQEMKVDRHTHNIEERRATLRLEMIERSHTMFGKEVKDVSPIKRSSEQIECSSDDLGRSESLRSEGEEVGTQAEGEEEVAEGEVAV